jgi:hypothetical protein
MSVTVTVEDGTGVSGANSYLSAADFEAYADARLYSFGADADAIASALIRATAWIDATYRSRWPGVRTYGAMQSLLWPRKAGSIVNGSYVPDRWMTTVTDAEGVSIATTEIPQLLKDALAEAAYRELNSPGSLSPDLERGGAIQSLQAGSVEIVYSTTARPARPLRRSTRSCPVLSARLAVVVIRRRRSELEIRSRAGWLSNAIARS